MRRHADSCSPPLPCTVCRHPSRIENRLDDIHIYRCPQCDHCFTDASALGSHEDYDHTYYGDDHRNWNEFPNVALFDYIIDRIGPESSKAAVLDLGCGEGHFLQRARERRPGWRLVGVDFLPRSLGPGIDYLASDLFDAALGRRFAAVVSLQVIEHIGDLDRFTQKLHELTEPGGLVFVSTINDRNPIYRTARTLGRLGYRAALQRIYSRHHLNHFNLSSLRRLMQAADFEVLATHRHGMPLAAVDYPKASPLMAAAYRLFISTVFGAAAVLRLALLQTIVCRQPEH